MTNTTTRRGLCGSSAALVAATALVAIPQASEAGPAGAHPDAALIAACAEWEAAERRMIELYEPPGRLTDDEAAVFLGPLEGRLVSLLDTLTVLSAATAAGVHARARLLASHNRASELSWDTPATMAGQLLELVMRDAERLCAPGGAIGPVMPAQQRPDAELVALADAIEAEHHETDAMDAARQAAGHSGFDRAFMEGTIRPRVRRSWAMRARLAATPAQSLDGFRAKARIVRLFSNAPGEGGAVDGQGDEAMAWSLASDLVGAPSGVVVPEVEGGAA